MSGRPGRVAVTIEADTACPGCGYNLRGVRLDGRCPECGRAAMDVFASPLRPADVYFASRMLTAPAGMAAGLWLAGVAGRGGGRMTGLDALVLGALAAAILAVPAVRLVVGAIGDAARIREGKVTRPLKRHAPAWRWLSIGAAAAGLGSAAIVGDGDLQVVWLALVLGSAGLLAAAQHVAAAAALEALRHFGQAARGLAAVAPAALPGAVVAWAAAGALPWALAMAPWKQLLAALAAGTLVAVGYLVVLIPLRRAVVRGGGPVVSLGRVRRGG